MSIMIDLPLAMAQEAREYATVNGTTLERMLFEYIKSELARKANADKAKSVVRARVLDIHSSAELDQLFAEA